MDKITLEYKAPENKKITYNEVEIEIVPVLNFVQQAGLINRYANEYFGQVENKLVSLAPHNYVEAEYNLMVYVIQTVTNIDVESLSFELLSDVSFWNEIVNNISNYSDFRKRLDCVVEEIKEEIKIQKSIGQVLDNALGKLSGLLEMFSNLNPEDIKELQKEGASLLSELEKSSIALASDVSKPKTEKK